MQQEAAQEMIEQLGIAARRAARGLPRLLPGTKNAALHRIADALVSEADIIISENAHDLRAAEKNGLSSAMVDRLRLTPERLEKLAQSVREVAALPDPVGVIENVQVRPNGLRIGHMRSPLGVVGIIYESRPNVTIDAGVLCLKSGNACILRGGSEAFRTNMALAQVMGDAATAAGIPEGAIQLVGTTARDAVGALLKADKYVDIIIPRGGKGLIQRIMEESTIPVIKHLDGNCSVYVDEFADLAMAERIIVNAKAQRPGVCNAAESLLVHRSVAHAFLPEAASALRAKGVELRGCPRTLEIIPDAKVATEEDWYAEYLDLILAVKIVDGFEEALDFIDRYGSRHTETIVTRDHGRAMEFLRAVDSACVHVNASTRFSDGGEYGLGAEIGISTDKLHARGPMGLRELTNAKWIVLGEGQIRE